MKSSRYSERIDLYSVQPYKLHLRSLVEIFQKVIRSSIPLSFI